VVETEALIHKIAQVGLDIKHIRRSNRTGYKAGALKKVCLAPKENLLFFDADFVPQKTGSIKPFYFKDPKLGLFKPAGDI
jgi:hypothetical protein